MWRHPVGWFPTHEEVLAPLLGVAVPQLNLVAPVDPVVGLPRRRHSLGLPYGCSSAVSSSDLARRPGGGSQRSAMRVKSTSDSSAPRGR